MLHRAWLEQKLINRIKHLQRLPIYVWVETDDVSFPSHLNHLEMTLILYDPSKIHCLLEACLYIQRNEATSRMAFIHAYERLEHIPSELEANSKILDEAFPAMTIDLVFLKGSFSPTV